jgi:hypothetical protein
VDLDNGRPMRGSASRAIVELIRVLQSEANFPVRLLRASNPFNARFRRRRAGPYCRGSGTLTGTRVRETGSLGAQTVSKAVVAGVAFVRLPSGAIRERGATLV